MVRLGALVLPEYPGPETTAIWRRLDELGLAHAWTFDHLSWRTLRDRPWFDAMTTLAAAAAVTGRIELGTLVTSPNFRHPVAVARQAMTLDQLSGGRFLLGVGAGAAGPDDIALGAPPPTAAERADRFAEFVSLLDRLLRDRVTTFHGSHFHAVDVRMIPGCAREPRVPLAIAASGRRGMRLTARYADIWVCFGPPGDPAGRGERECFDALRVQSEMLESACVDDGRDPGSPRRLVWLSRFLPTPSYSPERLADAVGRCAAAGFTDVVIAYPRADGVHAGSVERFEAAVAHILQ